MYRNTFQDVLKHPVGLSVTIDANKKVVNFLDITMDLETGIYKPYIKDNDTPMYVNIKSNHPPSVIKNIPLGVNRRLSRISANKTVFDAAAPTFQEALQKSGYNHQLTFEPPQNRNTKRKCRKKPVTWFNPPFSSNVKSNVGKEFLKLVDRAFPPSNPLHKLFTRHTVKLSYKCMPNMAQAVARNNMKLLRDNKEATTAPRCNCRGGPANCPVEGKCQTKGVVYRATVKQTLTGIENTYTGMTGRNFKKRLYGHNTNMNVRPPNHTKLSEHIWKLKDNNINYTINWRILDRVPIFNPITRKCRVCLKEKFYIMYDRSGSSLNKRQEVFNTCVHRKSELLENFDT